jgi:Domain of unknown function (DUF4394)
MTFKSTTSALIYSAASAALFMGAAATSSAQQAATTATAAVSSSAVTVQGRGIASGLTLPNAPIYALTSDNAIYALRPGGSQYVRLGRVETDGGNLIGIDFRPADNTPTKLYGLTDLGRLYIIDVSLARFGQKTRLSTMNPRFTGGLGMLVDFNPVANALRVAGSNDQNLAVVNGGDGSNLSTTVTQTTFVYAAGDVNAGKDPELVGGAYTNNYVGATNTLFYAVDGDTDMLVTIADKTATGSSNTGGGQLQTVGPFVDEAGNTLNMSPTTDLDIYTDRAGNNYLVGQTTRLLFTIDLSQINPDLKLGETQPVVVKRGPPAPLPRGFAPLTGGVFDIAIPPQQ